MTPPPRTPSHEPSVDRDRGSAVLAESWPLRLLRWCGVVVAVGAVLWLVGWYGLRHWRTHKAAEVLDREGALFARGTPPWYDRWPAWSPPWPIEEVCLPSAFDANELVPALARLRTVRQVVIDNPSHAPLPVETIRLLATIDSTESFSTFGGITADQCRALAGLRLKELSVSGADVSIPVDALEVLYTIPTLKRVGTARGESDVPATLRAKRPDIQVDVTDFPP